MDYIYDIVLNFHESYYEFYEWKSTDKIINFKKIPIYKVSTKTYLDIKNNTTIIDKETISRPNKIFLITNGIEVMGLLIDSTGKVLKKSSLIFEESDDILEDKDLIKNITLKYTIIKSNNKLSISRLSEEKEAYLNNYFHKISPSKDEYLLKYIYYDIYNEEESDTNKIYKELLNLSKKDKSKLYTTIKKINLELKQ